MSDLFSQEPQPEDVEGAAALLGDAAPVREDAESVEALASAGVPLAGHCVRLPDRCPSCGVALPDPNHPVDASLRGHTAV